MVTDKDLAWLREEIEHYENHASDYDYAEERIDRLRRIEAALTARQEPVAWLHTLTAQGKRPAKEVSMTEEHPFNLRQEKHACFIVTEPLYAAPPAPAVTVNALEWVTDYQRQHAYALFGGCYSITEYKGMDHPFSLEARGFSGSLSRYFDALEEAKAAAQADYERRILSALNTSTQHVNETSENEQVIQWTT